MEISSPSAFDALLNDTALQWREAARQLPDTVLGKTRRAHLAMMFGTTDDEREALDLLVGLSAAPARGVRMLLHCSLKEFDEVLKTDPEPQGDSPLELEDAMHAYTALAISYGDTDQFELAHINMMAARTLARALRATGRLQMLDIEWARVGMLRGHPVPEFIEEHLVATMTSQRRSWGQRTLAESLMSLGCYRDALRALGGPGNDSPDDAALREFLHALLSLPQARLEGDPITDPTLPYSQLADALRRQAPRWCAGLADITAQPEALYARLFEADALLESGMPQQVMRLLGKTPVALPSVALSRAAFMLEAVADGAVFHANAILPRDQTLLEQISQAVTALRSPAEAFEILRRHKPPHFVLLALSPLKEHIQLPGLPDIALLTGRHVVLHGQRIPMPGRCGRVAVAAALELPHDELKRSEKKRHAEAIAAIGVPVINLGWVAKAYSRMAEICLRSGQPNESAAWHIAHRQVVEMLSDDVKEMLFMLPTG